MLTKLQFFSANPDETENCNEKENIGSPHDENQQSHEFTMASVQKYILTQGTENIVKKTDYDLNVWKRLFLEVGETEKLSTYLHMS